MQRKPVYNTRQNQPQCNLGKYLGGYNTMPVQITIYKPS